MYKLFFNQSCTFSSLLPVGLEKAWFIFGLIIIKSVIYSQPTIVLPAVPVWAYTAVPVTVNELKRAAFPSFE